MHVCHICDYSLEGDYFRHMVAGLTKRGVRVSLIQLTSGTPPSWLKEYPETSFMSLEAAGKWAYPNAVRRLAGYLKREKVDILQTHLFFSGVLGVLAKRLYSKVVVAMMRHHTSVVSMLGSRFHVRADRWMAEKADRVLTVSEAARNYMRDVDHIRRSDIDVIYLGFDFDRFKPDSAERVRVRDEFGIEPSEFVIGFIGNFAVGKGHIQLVDAFGRILAEIPNARLLFAGRGELTEVKEEAAKLPSGKVIFAGWRTDVPACLNAMDLFVQPSLSEAFSQVLIEAMGVGLPVIATDVGGANEVIRNGENGILIDPDDPEAIARNVVKLCHDKRLRESLAASGSVDVRERFDQEQMVERHYELYQSWLKET